MICSQKNCRSIFSLITQMDLLVITNLRTFHLFYLEENELQYVKGPKGYST